MTARAAGRLAATIARKANISARSVRRVIARLQAALILNDRQQPRVPSGKRRWGPLGHLGAMTVWTMVS